MLSAIEIAQRVKLDTVEKIAQKLKLNTKYLIPYGKYIAKIDLGILEKIKTKPKGKYVVVTAITPTPLGEGKTVTTIGLSMGLNRIGKLTSTCIRQPSLGPVFGIKGGAAGGGYSQVLPMEDFNLHFTGDVHAVGLAHNLAAAFLDNSLLKGNILKINQEKIYFKLFDSLCQINNISYSEMQKKINSMFNYRVLGSLSPLHKRAINKIKKSLNAIYGQISGNNKE